MANNESRYSIRWRENSYVADVTGALAAMHGQGLLVDVTLSSEGRRVGAHRLLLAACSPYFRDLFAENPCAHPVVIFRDVAYEDLADVVHFVYYGEVSVPHRRLRSFLATAELLQVRGLADSEPRADKRKHPDEDGDRTVAPRLEEEVPAEVSSVRDSTPPPIQREENIELNTIDPTTEGPPKDPGQSARSTNSSSSQPTQVADDKLTISEGELIKFRCQLCWKGFKHPTSLTLHKDSHTGKTQCPVCRRSFSRSYDMRSHLMKIHQDQSSSPPPPPQPADLRAKPAAKSDDAT